MHIRVARQLPWVRSGDPALRVMSDFTAEPPFTVSEVRTLEGALDDMFRCGVRALLVVRDNAVTGLITSHDIRAACLGSPVSRNQLEVRHVRTPWKGLTVISWHAVRHLSVAEALALLREKGASHLVVVEEEPSGSAWVRGLISRARIERQLAWLDPAGR